MQTCVLNGNSVPSDLTIPTSVSDPSTLRIHTSHKDLLAHQRLLSVTASIRLHHPYPSGLSLGTLQTFPLFKLFCEDVIDVM